MEVRVRVRVRVRWVVERGSEGGSFARVCWFEKLTMEANVCLQQRSIYGIHA